MPESVWLWADEQPILWSDGQEILIEAEAQFILGGKQGRVIREKEWHYVNAAEIKAARRRERERLAISEAQQRRIDKAARKIAKAEPSLPGGLLTPPAVQAMPAFGALLAALQPTEGMVAALVQAIMDRIEAMRFEAEEEDVIVNFLMEM